MKRQVIIHPLLVAVFPVLHLFRINRASLDLDAVIAPALTFVGLVALIWSVAKLFTACRQEAAVIASLSLISLYAFAPAYAMLAGSESLSGSRFVAVDAAIAVTLVLLALNLGCFFKLRRYTSQWTYALNVVSLTLVVLPLTAIGFRDYKAPFEDEPHPAVAAPGSALPYLSAPAPDIYYLILDGYGRADVLDDLYSLDNSELLNYLKDKQFYIPERSTSNYSQTLLSLASSLNYTYLDEITEQEVAASAERRFLRDLIGNNRVVSFLKTRHYSIVNLGSEIDLEIEDADQVAGRWWFLSQFHMAALNLTPLPRFLARLGWPPFYEIHRSRIQYALQKLPELAAQPGPKFVFAHILAPHPPFVFGPNGERINRDQRMNWNDGDAFLRQPGASREQYIEDYRAQAGFVNTLLRAAVEGILKRSEQAPIVIIQGDHGPGSRLNHSDLAKTDVRERFGILNAYYFPAGQPRSLYDSISPVNSFRVVFNEYFGTRYPLLEDRSYFATWEHPLAFVEVGREMAREGAAHSASPP